MGKINRLLSDLISIAPDIQICFPAELGIKNRNIYGEIIEEKYHIMKVKEWIKQKKGMFTINEDVLAINEGEFTAKKLLASRYATKKVNSKFYSVIKIEGKSSD